MSLISVDITKVGRLSLKDLKLPDQEVKIETPPQPESTPPVEEMALSERPILKALAERLDLQVVRLRELLEKERRYTKKEAIDQIIERVGGYTTLYAGNISRKKGSSFTSLNLITGIEETIKDIIFIPHTEIKAVNTDFKKRALATFDKMISKGILMESPPLSGYYHLSGSTPF